MVPIKSKISMLCVALCRKTTHREKFLGCWLSHYNPSNWMRETSAIVWIKCSIKILVALLHLIKYTLMKVYTSFGVWKVLWECVCGCVRHTAAIDVVLCQKQYLKCVEWHICFQSICRLEIRIDEHFSMPRNVQIYSIENDNINQFSARWHETEVQAAHCCCYFCKMTIHR